MANVQRSQAFLRKRKMMLVLPLLVIPFLTMAFWALGGGTPGQKGTATKVTGLNLDLPDAHLKDDNASDKLSFYDRADKDLAKRGELEKSDPYFKLKTDTTIPVSADLTNMTVQTATKYNQRMNTSPYQSPNVNAEEKLMEKLAMLQREMAKPVTGSKEAKTDVKSAEDNDAFTAQISRLEEMMQGVATSDSEDPEMKQMNTALDKILDIQHPQRVQERMKEKSAKQKGSVFKINKSFQPNKIGLVDTPRTSAATIGFYGIEPWPEQVDEDNGIEAVVNGYQTLVNGAVLQLRLASNVYISGKLVPKGTTMSGSVSLNGERLEA